jgi:hypothetical protein
MRKSDSQTFELEALVASSLAQASEPAMAGDKGRVMPNAARHSVDPFDKFPRWWTLKMRDAGVGSFKLALLLLHLNWKSRGRPVVVSAAAAKDRGVGTRQKVTAVLELERLGIIRVERRPKKSSLITVLIPPRVVPKQP